MRVGGSRANRILELVRQTFNPEALLEAFEQLSKSLDASRSESVLETLGALFAASNFLPRLLAARPGLLSWLAGSRTLNQEKPLDRFVREAAASVRPPLLEKTELYRRLRRYKYRELLRLAVRDAVKGAPMISVGREMASLAVALVRAALSAVEQPLVQRCGSPQPPGFCVLGLGKLGGEDLNFSSDVDLIYLYRADGETQGGPGGTIPNIQYFTKLSESLTQALSTTTADGFCFRVDLSLRPQGRGGAIVLSLPAMMSYYETLGRTWERAALLKARVIAGDQALGEELLESLSPFIWRRGLDLTAVNELRDLKAQIDLRGKASAQDVKLGPGGIREIEFFANALQLLHGGKKPFLRERHTVKALRKLEQEGLIAATDADALEEAYVFLRRVENRLQMLEEQQTHALPSAEPERSRMARSLGFSGWDDFARELQRHRAYVQEAFSELLGRTAREEVPDEPRLALALDLDSPEPERRKALQELGFTDPQRALAALDRLSRIPEPTFQTGTAGPSLRSVKLLSELVRTADPDQALLHFAEFIGQLRTPDSYFSFLAQAPALERRLLNLFGQSDFLSRYFVGHPELLDLLVQTSFGEVHKDPARLAQELSARLSRSSGLEERLSTMRRFKNEEVLRIGLNDISGELPLAQVAAQLTAIADAVLQEALVLAEPELRERYGSPDGPGGPETLAVIAMGKLGGGELGYHSDLDLIFVYSGAGENYSSGGSRGQITHHEYFAKWAQRLLHFMQMTLREGHLYRVDARLRPSGNKGTLVVSQQAFRDHHQRRAQLWERQALIKARGVAGDQAFFERLQSEVIHPLVYERPLPEGAAAEIHRLRVRMEREIAKEDAQRLNPKTGHGGLVDIEFATQYLQLMHGAKTPWIRSPNTLEAIEALRLAGHLKRADAELLTQAYAFLRGVENRLCLVHGLSLGHLQTSGRALALVGRRLGYLGLDPGAAFLSDYRTYTERVREVYARLLEQPCPPAKPPLS